ncbi:MAG: DUF1189 family protein [Patescibacteria group bacterium]
MATKTAAAPGFFKSIPASIYSPSFYAGIAGRSFWKGFWFLAGFTFLSMIVGALVLFVGPYLSHRDQINETIDQVLHSYPEELVITIQDGKASSNVQEPYFIKFNEVVPTESWSASFKEGFEDELAMEGDDVSLEELNLVVIDTVTPFSLEQFQAYHTAVWLTQDAIYVVSENNGTEAFPLAESEDTIVNKAFVDAGMDTVWGGIKNFIPFAVALLFIFAFLGFIIARLVYLLIFAVFMMIVFSVMKLPYDYAAGYKIGFYAFSLSTLVSIVLAAFSLPGFFLMGTLISLLVAVINLDQAKKQGLIKEKKAE